jgi:hypothetical protein
MHRAAAAAYGEIALLLHDYGVLGIGNFYVAVVWC